MCWPALAAESPLPLSCPVYSHAKNNFRGTSHLAHLWFDPFGELSVAGNGGKSYVYLKVMMQKEETTEAEQFLRKQIKASAERSEAREGTEASKDLSLVNLIHTFC